MHSKVLCAVLLQILSYGCSDILLSVSMCASVCMFKAAQAVENAKFA